MVKANKGLAKLKSSKWALLLAGLALGVLIVLAVRFVNYQVEEKVHYHANFAVYINGQREQFASPTYYEETAGSECNLEEHEESPLERAHLHDNVNDVVHIEDHMVTWGHFFQNLDWAVDAMHVKTRDQVMLADEVNKVTFILNGKKVDSINQLVVGDEDRLLVDFGATNQSQLDKYFGSVAATAGKYNVTPDPAACGAGDSDPNFTDRLKNLF